MADSIVRGGTLVYPDKRLRADVRISDGRIAEIGPELAGAGDDIDARGMHVFPGVIDVHLHFNEPGRTDWEGAATGSRALAAGGGTLFFDMPLNSTPCTVNAHEVDRKRAALEAASVTDFGIWGGLIPGSVGHMAEMAERGVVGFKAFMCDSGLPEFPCADEATLRDGMREAARLDLPVAVHAESQEMTRDLASRMQGSGVRDFLDSRPVAAELEKAGIDTLVIVPDGALRTIPLGALYDGKQFLVERYALATTPGLTLTDPQPIKRERANLLLHGLTDSWWSWSEVLPHLPSSWRVLVPSHRGHGDSESPAAASAYAVEEMARDVLALLDAKGIDRAVVVGHSMGGTIAERVTVLAPRRVRALVLVGTTASWAGHPGVQELQAQVAAWCQTQRV